MFQHTLLLAYRHLLRFKSTFFINLIGLSTGLACVLLIYLWVSDELAVDKFHEKDEQLYEVMTKIKVPGGDIMVNNSTPHPLAEALATEMPEVEYGVPVRLNKGDQGILAVANKQFRASEWYVGPDFFKIFSYSLTQGDKKQPLPNKFSVLLSDEMAKKLFPNTKHIIGKKVEWNKEELSGTYFVSGVFKKPPPNATAQFDLLFSFEQYRERKPRPNEWANGGATTYIILKKNTNLAQFNRKIGAFLQTKNNDPNWSLFVRPYSDQYLYGKYENGVPAGGRIEYVRLFSIIAFFILIIACINFMNLSTAKASRRLKEIGVKKVFGANRKTLLLQYLGESMLLTLLALTVAMVLVILLLPPFNQVTGKQLSLHFEPHFILAGLSIALFTGMLAGSYPALYLSGFAPITVLKGKLISSAGEVWVRKGLVVFQFAASVILIVAVLVVYQQVAFIQSKNLGYSRDNVIIFKKEGKLIKGYDTFLKRVKNIPGVVNATTLWGNMTQVGNITSDLKWPGQQADESVEFNDIQVGYDFIETLGIEVKEGRTFSRKFIQDSSAIILNEAAVEAMGLQEPIGKTVELWGEKQKVIGVVKNFHAESLYEPLKPCFMTISPVADNIAIKIKAGTEKQTIAQIEQFYKEYNGSLSFEFTFLDQDYQKLYAAESRVGILSRYFAGLAILISCLGLFGLATFTAERRRKEIGVRKVLGASQLNIVYLLSSDFTKMVLVAIFISLPASYLLVKYWLQNFEYRINLEWWYFAGAGVAALLISWLTVGSQAIKAASINPARSLKEE